MKNILFIFFYFFMMQSVTHWTIPFVTILNTGHCFQCPLNGEKSNKRRFTLCSDFSSYFYFLSKKMLLDFNLCHFRSIAFSRQLHPVVVVAAAVKVAVEVKSQKFLSTKCILKCLKCSLVLVSFCVYVVTFYLS